jgi:biotin carboxyl carrier protein
MRRIVNGVVAELTKSNATIEQVNGRLLVKSADGTNSAAVVRKGDRVYVSYRGRIFEIDPIRHGSDAAGTAANEERAHMPGQVIKISASVGDQVQPGDPILVLEAMKMQQEIAAPLAGRVAELPVTVGDQVSEGDLLVRIDAEEE